MVKEIDNRIAEIDGYLDRKGFSSYDPYDGLSSPLAGWLVKRNQLFARIWQQSIRLLPINIRPLIGIKKMVHTKAISDFASAYCLHYKLTQSPTDRERAVQCLATLMQIRLQTDTGYGWGLRFPFATRFVQATAAQANIFQTINAIHSFLDGYEALQEIRYLEIAEKGCLFLEKDLGYVETEDTVRWNYWKNLDVQILNISGLMIGLCTRMWALTKKDAFRVYASKLFNYIKQNQNSDGSWYYSLNQKGHFIDGFHTGYILEGLIRGIEGGVLEKDECIKRGIDFYIRNFFTEDMTPRYFHHSTYPLDGQNMAQALQTLHFILNVNFVAKNKVIACFERVDELLWNKKGYYNYKRTLFWTIRTPMHRWVTGPMLLALVYLKKQYL